MLDEDQLIEDDQFEPDYPIWDEPDMDEETIFDWFN